MLAASCTPLQGPDAGPAPPSIDVHEFCGDRAELETDPNGIVIVGRCEVENPSQLSSFNDSKVRFVRGQLVLLGASDSFADGVFTQVEKVTELQVDTSATIESVQFPLLQTVESLDIYDNSVLSHVDFPALHEVSRNLTITGNRRLPECDVTALREQLTVAPETEAVAGNCEPCCGQ